MRLLVVTTYSDRSEVSIYADLVRRGHTVEMACMADSPERHTLARAGVTVNPIRVRHRLDLAAAADVRRRVAAFQPDVVYAPRNGSLAVTLLATRGRRPSVVAYRGTIGHLSRFDPASWLTYLHPRVARICCVSDAVRDYLQTFRLPESRLVTVHKGHDVAWYDAMPKPSRRDLGLPDGPFILGFTGRVRPVKGGDVLLEALARLPPALGVHLVIVGEIVDPEVQRLAAAPALRGRVHTLGFRRDAAAIASTFDAFAMPSIEREGLPRAVIEAMSQGIAPIVTRVGGMPELVVDGECGLVVPPRDALALSAAIESLARDPARCSRLGQAARARIVSHFNIRDTTDRMERLFLDAAPLKTASA